MSTEFINDQWRLPNAWNGSESNVNKQSNYSMDFDSASSDYIETTNFSALSGLSEASLSLWFKTNLSQNGKCIFSIPKNVNEQLFSLYLNTTSLTSYITTSTGLKTTISSSITISNNQWHHIAVTYNGSYIKIYFNNVEVATLSATGTISSSTVNTIQIGRYGPQYSNYVSGQIDAVSIFNYALSSSQITTLYGSSSTGIGNPMSLSPKPVAYYPLGDQDAFNGANYLVPNSSLKDYVFDNIFSSAINTPYNLTATSNITVSIWFKTTTNAQSNKYLFSYGNNQSIFDLRLNGTDVVQPIIKIAGVQIYPNISFNYADGNWHQYIVNYDGSNIKVYIDGILKNKSSYSGNLSVGSTNFVFANLSTTTGVTGEVSNCTIHTATLTDGNVSQGSEATGEIATFYNYGSPIQTLSSIPQNSDLKVWYKLNASATYDSSTTTWTIPDDSTNSNDGTSSGMTQANLVQSDLSFTSGYSPYALDFEYASSQNINVGTVNLSNNWSVSFWAAWNHSNARRVALNGSNGLLQYTPQATSAGKIRMYPDDTTNDYFDVTPAINDGNWHNVVFSYDNNTTTLNTYTDGILSDSRVNAASATNLQFIGGGVGGWFWEGKLSNCSIWNTNLSATQVTEIYNEGVPSNLNNHSAYSNLTNWWQLGSNSSFNTNWTVLDEKGSNNGTSANMTEDDIVDGVGSYANGLSSGMGGDEVIGDAPYSTANSLSVNMDVLDRVTDTPS